MTSADGVVGIAVMADLSGLSSDTLRWYEKEGVLPRVPRGLDGRRRYSRRDRDLLALLAALREAGMPTRSMKQFVELVGEGASSHGRRITLLSQTRDLLDERRRSLDSATSALNAKIAHYEQLIADGRDCDGAAVEDCVREQQSSRGPATERNHP